MKYKYSSDGSIWDSQTGLAVKIPKRNRFLNIGRIGASRTIPKKPKMGFLDSVATALMNCTTYTMKASDIPSNREYHCQQGYAEYIGGKFYYKNGSMFLELKAQESIVIFPNNYNKITTVNPSTVECGRLVQLQGEMYFSTGDFWVWVK